MSTARLKLARRLGGGEIRQVAIKARGNARAEIAPRTTEAPRHPKAGSSVPLAQSESAAPA